MTTTQRAGVTRGTESTWWPTRKWWAAQVATVATLLVAWVNAGEWNKTLTVAVVGFASQALITYLVPNQPTPGGVPVRHD